MGDMGRMGDMWKIDVKFNLTLINPEPQTPNPKPQTINVYV